MSDDTNSDANEAKAAGSPTASIFQSYDHQATGLIDATFAETLGLSMHNAINSQLNAQMSAATSVTSACNRILQCSLPSAPPAPAPAPAPSNEAQTTDQSDSQEMSEPTNTTENVSNDTAPLAVANSESPEQPENTTATAADHTKTEPRSTKESSTIPGGDNSNEALSTASESPSPALTSSTLQATKPTIPEPASIAVKASTTEEATAAPSVRSKNPSLNNDAHLSDDGKTKKNSFWQRLGQPRNEPAAITR